MFYLRSSLIALATDETRTCRPRGRGQRGSERCNESFVIRVVRSLVILARGFMPSNPYTDIELYDSGRGKPTHTLLSCHIIDPR
jgi:hypothetical protein